MSSLKSFVSDFCEWSIVLACLAQLQMGSVGMALLSLAEAMAASFPWFAMYLLTLFVFCVRTLKLRRILVWLVVNALLLIICSICLTVSKEIPSWIPMASKKIGLLISQNFNVGSWQPQELTLLISLVLFLIVFMNAVVLAIMQVNEEYSLPQFTDVRRESTMQNVSWSSSLQSIFAFAYSDAVSTESPPAYSEAASTESPPAYSETASTESPPAYFEAVSTESPPAYSEAASTESPPA
jgi:magnesium-transporting ATPase (P-type)